jgi:hypothetical protein
MKTNKIIFILLGVFAAVLLLVFIGKKAGFVSTKYV